MRTEKKREIAETKIVDARLTEIGRENWAVCHRMLVHDLLDMDVPQVKELLRYYSIYYMPNGGYSMALPRKMLPQFQKQISGHTRKSSAVKDHTRARHGGLGERKP